MVQTGYREYILTGKCGGSSKGDDDLDDASNLERWENVQHLVKVAADHFDGPRRLSMPSVDGASPAESGQMRSEVRCWLVGGGSLSA